MKNDEYKELADRFLTEHRALMKYAAESSLIIATRTLFFTLKGEVKKNKLTVELHAPFQVGASIEEGAVPHDPFACYIGFSHLCDGYLFYGFDEFQALSFALDLDPLLRMLDKKCNLYFTDHTEDEFYFDDACNRW